MLLDFNVNGQNYKIVVEEKLRLLDVLREKLDLTGPKEGCGEGECGACTVIVDDLAVNACLIMAHQVMHKHVTTVEGLEENGELGILQQAFIDHGAIQCGFCTPGMMMSAKALLIKNANPTEEEIKKGIEGNLCRCTGYLNIIKAIKEAAVQMGKRSDR
ncbi:(2Fe-2S)-binding protein [Tindallia californiensis]|uniref:Carbon-monoxide dehydrogenase small subunit n=1 Tax=Tindallia californiensis TaxID=159292 RepID=A0A1H3MHS1_9FIRM|nr:(2Fe-2S)-binding protein [Tindallia californiensis]SDY75898.1 carbon-monoxide dehydrogenase small subunit [Tindallia californiensis]